MAAFFEPLLARVFRNSGSPVTVKPAPIDPIDIGSGN
jgi:hypothetical protein